MLRIEVAYLREGFFFLVCWGWGGLFWLSGENGSYQMDYFCVN